MSPEVETSDVMLLDLLRKAGPLSVSQLAEVMGVTATAVRQRLSRLIASGYIQRTATKALRGRPSHRYDLTDLGRRKTGANFADLAIALWQEIRAIADPEVRRGLLQRIAKRLAVLYGEQVDGKDIKERMEQISAIFADRRVPFSVEQTGTSLPVLTAHACPYPTLAEQDRTICSVEKMLFSDLIGQPLSLTNCRLDGGTCCTFEVSGSQAGKSGRPLEGDAGDRVS